MDRLFAFLFILLGIIEAIWGLGQLYGVVLSRHDQFLLTGSFYNPGPYTGFLAMIFPVAFYEWLHRRKERKTIAGNVAWAAMLLIGCLIPCGMSRTAWLAVSVGTGYVVMMHESKRIVAYWKKYRKRFMLLSGIALTGLAVAASAAYVMKKDSADGRLLMWKVAARAVMERPLSGRGWNQVAGAYGQAQEDYFASGAGTSIEEWVAGAPEYVFNEYLQVALAWGIPVLLLGLVVVGAAFYVGHRNRAYGLCGALLSLAVFAFASYPLQFLEFVVTGILLVASCFLSERRQSVWYKAVIWMLTLVSCAVYGYKYMERKRAEDSWEVLRMYYYSEDYKQTVERYEPLYESLSWNPKYLFEYAHAMHKEGRYEKSSVVMKEAMKHSSDAMILNILGKNCQALGQYEKAEEWYIRSTHRLPNRLYSYYLLAKLYAEPGFYRPDKCRETIEKVLGWKPKVPSEAIEEMKRELETLKENLL